MENSYFVSSWAYIKIELSHLTEMMNKQNSHLVMALISPVKIGPESILRGPSNNVTSDAV